MTEVIPCDILLPVFNGLTQARRCLDSLSRYLPDDTPVHLLDDASTDLRIGAWLDTLEGHHPWLHIHRFEQNLGFVGNINRGLAQTRGDVVLLNSDTLVTPGWLERMLACAASDPAIGIVCPLSNNATILSVPEMNRNNPLPAGLSSDAFAMLLADRSRRRYPRLPVAVGFCMLIRRPVLDAIGLLHEAFELGYGEECDFSLRAWQAGFQVVCCDDAFVYHEGERSFATVAGIDSIRARNAAMLETRWPFYNDLIRHWCQHNPLRPVQEGIHTALCAARGDRAPHVLTVIHAYESLGGTELHSKQIAEHLADRYRLTLLYPDSATDPYRDLETRDAHEFVRLLRYPLRPATDDGEPVPEILGCRATLRDARAERTLRRLIEAGDVRLVHFQHLLHWGSLALPLIAKSQGAAVLLSLHDYYLFCPVFDLLDRHGRACGKAGADPDDPVCQDCIGDHGKGTLTATAAAAYLKARAQLLGQVFAAADALVAPSDYVRAKFVRRYGSALAAKLEVIPHGLPRLAPQRSRAAGGTRRRRFRIGIFANLTRRKGAETVMAAARLLIGIPDLEFAHHGGVDAGYRQTLATSGIVSSGPYAPDELPARAAGLTLALVPSVYEETYCLTIAELQALGLPVLAFRIGAVAERIDDGRTGFLVDRLTPEALASRIRALLDRPDQLRRVGQQLRNQTFKSIQRNAQDYDALYQRLIEQPGGHRPSAPPDDLGAPEPDIEALLPGLLPAHLKKHPLTASIAMRADAAYRLWLERAPCPLPIETAAVRDFARQLDVLIVDLGRVAAAGRHTLDSLQPAMTAGARATLMRADSALDGQSDSSPALPDGIRSLRLAPADLARQINRWIAEHARPWILLLPAGVHAHPTAIALFAAYCQAHPRWTFIYTDDDLLAEDGRRYRPRFKPDFNLDLARSQDYIGAAALFAREPFRRRGGFARFPQAAIYDLCLRFLDEPEDEPEIDIGAASGRIGHIPQVLLHYRDHPRLLAAPDLDSGHHRRALAAHLERRHLRASVQTTGHAELWWVDYRPPRQRAFSLIVLAHDAGDAVAATIDNLRSVTDSFEVVVLDFKGSCAAHPVLRQRGRELPIRMLPAREPRNIASELNRAIHACNRESILVTHDGMRFHRHGLIPQLLGLLARPEVALVGPCVLDRAGRILHSYPISGFWPFGASGQLHAGETLAAAGYLNRNLCPQNCVTVSDSFFALCRSAVLQCGGFSGLHCARAWYMLDLGLRLAAAGYLNVWTPHVTLVQEEAGSFHRWRRQTLNQAEIAEEVGRLYEHHLPRLAHDPAYNPHLSLREPGGIADTAFPRPWDPRIHQGLRLLGFPGDRAGSGYYRVIDPLESLEEARRACHLIPAPGTRPPGMAELERLAPTALLLHNALGDEYLFAMELYRQYTDVLLVLSLDDLITELPAWNPFRATNYPDMDARLRRALACCDRLLVSTPLLAEVLADRYPNPRPDIVVVPNRLRGSRWLSLPQAEEASSDPPRKPRIGWAGAAQHEGDLLWLAPAIEQLADEADWYFFGMCPAPIRPFARAQLRMVDFPAYPHKLCSISLDLAIAPLAMNDFNRCKSNLKILEHGILGTPVICSDIEPYRKAPVTRLANEPPLWVEALRERIHDLQATRREGETLRQWVCDRWLLEQGLDAWQASMQV